MVTKSYFTLKRNPEFHPSSFQLKWVQMKRWIDPYDYQNELGEAVEFLAGQGMHVSIYNTPLCVLPERLWKFARKSGRPEGLADGINKVPNAALASKHLKLKKHRNMIRNFPGGFQIGE